MEAAAAARAESHSRGAKPPPRRTSSRRLAKKTTLSPLRQIPSPPRRRQGSDDDSKMRPQIRDSNIGLFADSNRQDPPNWAPMRARTKRIRCFPAPNNKKWGTNLPNLDDIDLTCLPPPPHNNNNNNNWRDWANLADGPAGLIADKVLACDVADYVRFRAVCRPWRQFSTDPRSHSGLDRRFHPWRWTMLREELTAPDRRCFLNTTTGECVQVDIPELQDYDLLALTPEGLLVLLHKKPPTTVGLLNPLTRHLTELPPLTTLLPSKDHHRVLDRDDGSFNTYFTAWGSGIASDDSTFVLCFKRLCMLGMAKPGDNHWTLLKYSGDGMTTSPLMFQGRFYCVNRSGVMLLETGPDQPPRLEVAAKLSMRASPIADSVHLVNNCGELMLVHRWCGPMTEKNKSGRGYNAYRVDLDNGTLLRVKTLGGTAGRALFMGMRCSLSVSLECFPSGSISADTIYLGFDVGERRKFKVGAYHLVDGIIQHTSGGLVPRPHTLADCLSLSSSVQD